MIAPSIQNRSRAARAGRGFTTVELIVVMVLIGILSAIGVGRFFDRSGFDSAAFTDQARALLRYAQKAAIARNTPVYVQLDDNRIALCYAAPQGNCAPADRVAAPGSGLGGTPSTTHCQDERWYCIGLPQGVQLSAAMTEFGFDALGRPIDPNGKFDGLTVTIASPGESRSISVNQETGYVQ